MGRSSRTHKGLGTFAIEASPLGQSILPAVDKLIMTHRGELTIVFETKCAVSICADDAYALYLFLTTKAPLRYSEVVQAIKNETEETVAA